jgi:hypothetical protein
VPRPARSGGPRQRNQAALAAAKDKLERRKEARHLVATNPALARDVEAARDKLSRFVSAEELCEYTRLSPDRVDELRDLMIFT